MAAEGGMAAGFFSPPWRTLLHAVLYLDSALHVQVDKRELKEAKQNTELIHYS